MTNQSVFCIATSHPQAERIVDQLQGANFALSDISGLFAGSDNNRSATGHNTVKVPEGTAALVGTGGSGRSGLKWIPGSGAPALPGVGPVTAAGPIIAALNSAATGDTAGIMTSSLLVMGIPELEAKRYERRLKEGNILICVQTENTDETSRAENVFSQAGAEDVCLVVDATTPNPHKGSKSGECCTPASACTPEATDRQHGVAIH